LQLSTTHPQHSAALRSTPQLRSTSHNHNAKNQKPKEHPDDFSGTPKKIPKQIIDTIVVYQSCHASTRAKAIKQAKRQEKG
jgi:hypothetical protein